MSLRKWIANLGGPRAAAKLIGTYHPTIYDWLRGETIPTLKLAREIVRASKGAVSYEDIVSDLIGPTFPEKGRARRARA